MTRQFSRNGTSGENTSHIGWNGNRCAHWSDLQGAGNASRVAVIRFSSSSTASAIPSRPVAAVGCARSNTSWMSRTSAVAGGRYCVVSNDQPGRPPCAVDVQMRRIFSIWLEKLWCCVFHCSCALCSATSSSCSLIMITVTATDPSSMAGFYQPALPHYQSGYD